MALIFDLEIEQGSDYVVAIPILDEDDRPVDASGWSGRAQIRRTPTSPTVLHEWVPGDGLTVDGTDVVLTVPGSTSALWAWVEAAYDLELVSPGGRPVRFARGRVLVDRETTR